jgi:nucleoid DNA-binding protein
MNKKQTFKDIITAVSQETDQNNSLTRNFLHNLSEVIRDELSKKEKVHIAQFGIFEVKQIKESETVVFKPYKNLREAVNQPFAHLEPQFIGNENRKQNLTSTSDASSVQMKKNKLRAWVGAGTCFLAATAVAWFLLRRS